MSATMTEIAQSAGVSVAVVSRLLRGDPALRISDRRRREIFKVRDEMGGVKMQRRRLTHTIVLPVNRLNTTGQIQQNLTDPLYLYPSFQQALAEAGFHLHLEPVDCADILPALRSLVESPRRCDGIVIATFGMGNEISEILAAHRFPHVSSDHDAERFNINSVDIHRTEGVRRAIEHLKELGHRRVGFLGIRGNYSYANFAAAMAAEGLAIDESLHHWMANDLPALSDRMRHAARQSAGPWLQDRNPASSATAMICQNDQFALGLIDAMRDRGLAAGRDLSVVGFDNLEQRRDPPAKHPILTTVHNPIERRGQRMAELLLNQILHGQTQIIHERVPVKLIIRSSTGLARPNHTPH
jgi:LacI family transcriptional regulator